MARAAGTQQIRHRSELSSARTSVECAALDLLLSVVSIFPPMQPDHAPDTLGAAEQELSRAETFSGMMEIVGHYARELTGADGATFVLKEGENCFYAEEDAIGPLWKGRRFPQTSCISGWVMMNAKPAIVENVLEDPRIPTEVYRPTFVRSLVMVPVGAGTPMAAIGAYWARSHRPTQKQLDALTALAKAVVATMTRVA